MARILLPPEPVSWSLQVETGMGKTEVAISAAARAIKAGMYVVYSVPRHDLGDELVPRFAAENTSARVYRGYAANDPDADASKMCLDLEAMSDAREVGLPVFSTVCDRHLGRFQCSRFGECGMTKQRMSQPAIWIITHGLLFHPRPEFIPHPNALVIDERFHTGAIPSDPVSITLDALQRADATIDDDRAASADLAGYRAALVRALRAHAEGPFSREMLDSHGVTFDVARAAQSLEWKRFLDPEIFPGSPAAVRSARVKEAAPVNKEIFAIAGIWEELTKFFLSEHEHSGRLWLAFDADRQALAIERRSLSSLHSDWEAPALILDATAPDIQILQPVLGHAVEQKASISAPWSSNGWTRQIIGAPVSASKLGIVKGKDDRKPDGRNIADLLRLIGLRAALAFPYLVAVVGQKALVAKFIAAGLPVNVEAGHFGALTGLDRWKGAAGMICIGRPLPDPRLMEIAAGVISGRPPLSAAVVDGFAWYDRLVGGVRLADGSGVRVQHLRHPDALAEALRVQSCEAEIVQAVGRLRLLRRERYAPFFLDIVSDVPLPLTVDAVETWERARPGPWAVMADDGVILQSPSDIMTAYKVGRKKARLMAGTNVALTSIETLHIDVGAIFRHMTYKRQGVGRKPAGALVLPNGPPSLKDRLEERLGTIEWVRSDAAPEQPTAANDNAEESQAAA